MPKEITNLLEGRALREVVNVVAVVRKNAALAVEITNRRGRGDDVLEAAFGFWFFHGHKSDDIRRVGAFGDLVNSRSGELAFI